MISIRIFALLLIASFPSAFAQALSSACITELCRLVDSGDFSSLRWSDASDYRTRVRLFYEPVGYAFAWTRAGLVTEQAKAMIQTLIEADAKGLNPEDYDGSRWASRVASLSGTGLRDPGRPPAESDFAEFDLTLTIFAMRYVSDLHYGRVNTGLFHAGFGFEDERIDLSNFLRQRLVESKDVKVVLESIEPPYLGYRRTEQALQRYIAMAREDRGGTLPITKRPVDPGDRYPAITQLADLLSRLGDLPEAASISPAPSAYQEPLVGAVKRFQTRHGLDPDGRIGKATFAQLNMPLSRRVLQLQLTLERWRWLPYRFPQPPIVVNVPEFVLRGLNGTYETELEMKVVVGKAYHHQTPVLGADMKSLIFRPYWNVPKSIQHDELVPKIEQDSSYLMNHGYEVVTAKDAVVTNGIVDNATLAQLGSGKLRIRQTPGPENALGLVKFLFPNDHDIYMHDTPAAILFSKSRRDFSHGCIRVEKPHQLAAWVLRYQPDWTPERIAATMNGEKTVPVALTKPIPVLIVYATAVVLASGEVRFFEDIYGQDARLQKLFTKNRPYPAGTTSAAPGQHPRE